MAPNAFIGRAQEPADVDVAEVLGPAKGRWDRLLADLRQECNLVECEWNSYSRKAGWALRLKRGKRNIVYLGPCRGGFRVTLTLGDKALEVARHSGLPQRVMRMLDEAKRYPEGTAVRFEDAGEKDLSAICKLITIKLAN